MDKEKFKEQIERLYQLNAFISLNYIGMKKKPTEYETREINHTIGDIIKEMRDMVDKG